MALGPGPRREKLASSAFTCVCPRPALRVLALRSRRLERTRPPREWCFARIFLVCKNTVNIRAKHHSRGGLIRSSRRLRRARTRSAGCGHAQVKALLASFSLRGPGPSA
eukprot:502371-Pyramimonas_sp.AAC.1